MIIRKKRKDTSLIDLIRRILKACGIEIRGDLVVAKRILGEGIARRMNIYSIDTFIRFFEDGKYVIEGEEVEILGLDPEPFEITWICIEGEYKDSNWKLTVRMDEEEISYVDPEKLNVRSVNIEQMAKTSLDTLSSLMQFAIQAIKLQDTLSNPQS